MNYDNLQYCAAFQKDAMTLEDDGFEQYYVLSGYRVILLDENRTEVMDVGTVSVTSDPNDDVVITGGSDDDESVTVRTRGTEFLLNIYKFIHEA